MQIHTGKGKLLFHTGTGGAHLAFSGISIQEMENSKTKLPSHPGWELGTGPINKFHKNKLIMETMRPHVPVGTDASGHR